MKYFLYICTIILTFNVSGQKTKKIIEKNGREKTSYTVLKNDLSVKHGVYTKTQNGSDLIIGKYSENKKVGIWTFNDRNGLVQHKYDYDKNVLIYQKSTLPVGDSSKYSRPAILLGGIDMLLYYIMNNYVMTSRGLANEAKGTIDVEFIISKSGKIENIKILKGIGFGCDEQAIKLFEECNLMWLPALDINGTPIESEKINCPIRIL